MRFRRIWNARRFWGPPLYILFIIAAVVVRKWWPVWSQNWLPGASVAATIPVVFETPDAAADARTAIRLQDAESPPFAPLTLATPSAQPEGAMAAASAVTPIPTSTPAPTEVPVLQDDWNYQDGDVQIHITPVRADDVEYYLADVRLRRSDLLHTGFARGRFGDYHEATSAQAKRYGAIFAVSGDYCGFSNRGIIFRNGELYRDKAGDDLAAFYADGTLSVMPGREASAEALKRAGALHTWSFGPYLVRDAVTRTDFSESGIRGRNPRAGIGYLGQNHLLFIVVDGRSKQSVGMTLGEFAELFAQEGCKQAYNLDGGGSATMVFGGRVVNNLMGKNRERGISDIIYVKPMEAPMGTGDVREP